MILRLSDALSRGLVVVAALVVASVLSFFGLRTAVAQLAAEKETAAGLDFATRLEPGNPEYWYGLGHFQEFNLEQPDSASAVASFRRAIVLDPQYTDAWLDLGTSFELDGNAKEARDAYLRAKQSYPASADVSWRYGNFLLREENLPLAYAELRRAIEADPRRAAAAFSRVYRNNANLDEILDQLLPPSQSAYLGVIQETTGAQQFAVARIVWARLITLHPRLEIRELDPFVYGLLLSGESAEARRVWDQGIATMNLPLLLQAPGSVVWDPSFESGINAYSFAWHYDPLTQGVRISLDSTEKHSGHQSLRLSFDGRHNPNLEAACTLAIVEPGTTYHFSGWIKTKALTTDQGIGFRLRPAGARNILPITTTEFHGTNSWTLVDQTLAIPVGVQRVQICIKRDPADNPDVRISGNAWVDDVNLVPEGAERLKP